MAKERFKCISACYLLLTKDGETLLSRRFNTGYEDGNYSVVAGHIEEKESAITALVREAKEEAGILINPQDVHLVHTHHRMALDERMELFFSTNTWKGEIVNLEPEKCSDLSWFPLNNLPPNTIPYIKHVLEAVERGEIYSEFGW